MSLFSLCLGMLSIIGAIYLMLYSKESSIYFPIFMLCTGVLFLASAYMFYKYGFQYGGGSFQITLGISFIGLGISSIMNK